MKTPNPNQTAKEELINADVPEHLHKLVTGLIVCITTEYDYRYEKAKEIVDYESLELSDKDIKLANNKALFCASLISLSDLSKLSKSTISLAISYL